jgi:Bardet-Biedl syndrome 7 protein
MEDIQLVVSDIFKCASVPRNCIRAIPLPAKAKLQKLVIGDESGNVTMISMAESDAASVESKFQHS